VPGSATTHEHVQRMLEQIHGNYKQRLTLGILARTLGRQSAYLGRLFRQEIGVTVHEYITRARIEYGAAHVRSGVKIEAVALDLGYQSKKNFYRQFRRRFGMTPEAYRHKHDETPVRDRTAARPSRDAQLRQADTADFSASDISTAGPRRTAGQSRAQASRFLLLAQTLMRSLVATRLAMLVTNDAGCYVGANKTALSMTGYSISELHGMSVEALFPHVSSSDTRRRLQILVPASSSLPPNSVLRTKSAGLVHVHLTSAENLLQNNSPER
jgi:PAS domain S-box-containing protein